MALGCIEQSCRIERLSFEPLVESRRGENGVELHRELKTIALRVERLQIDDTDFLKGRRLNLLDDRWQIEIPAPLPGAREDVRHERMLGAARRRLDTDQGQQADRRA